MTSRELSSFGRPPVAGTSASASWPGVDAGRWLRAGACLVLLSGATAGCLGSSTPLVPGLRGSVGVPHFGIQTDAVELPLEGPGFERLRTHDPARFGNPRLVRGLERAAALVERELPGGAPLKIGDLSAKHGGKVPRHNSHRTGRDVDLLWYVTTPAGAPIANPGFVRVGTDGLASVPGDDRYVALDIPRQWLLIRTLLLDPALGVQFLFASRSVEALLVDYAIARGEPLDLVWRAETVLLQPGDSAPHDDHVHVRIACSPTEAVSGCEGGGPYWEWLPEKPELGPLTPHLLAEIAREDPLDPPERTVEREPGSESARGP